MTIATKKLFGAVAIAGLFFAGCATTGSTSESTEAQTVQGSPPENAEPKPLPPGPDVKVGEPNIPGESSQESEADASTREAAAAEADQQSSSTTGERVAEGNLQMLLERGPASVFQAVEVEPFRKDGEFRGYEIVGASEAAKAVMKPQISIGDIVTHVNDVHLKKPDDYMRAWERLGKVTTIEVDILRDGEEKRAVWTVVSQSNR